MLPPEIGLYYFTKLLNSVPPKKINWMRNAMTFPVCRSWRLQHLPTTLYEVTSLSASLSSTRSKTTHCIDVPTTPAKRQCVSVVSSENNVRKSSDILKQTKWNSPEAVSFFVTGPKTKLGKTNKTYEDAMDVQKHIHSQISILRTTYLSADGCKAIIDNEDIENLCTSFDIFVIQLKARYLSVTLTQVLIDNEDTANFLDICATAIQKIDDIDFDGTTSDNVNDDKGIIWISSPRRLMQW
jgi:hypothetical protein